MAAGATLEWPHLGDVMKIQFTSKDPRAGRIVEAEKRRAEQFIAAGQAVAYSDKSGSDHPKQSAKPKQEFNKGSQAKSQGSSKQ